MTSLVLPCQTDMADTSDYEKLLQWADLVSRTIRNPKYSDAYCRMYLSTLDIYPQILEGLPVPIEVWRIREGAGWRSERTTSNFFRDMNAIQGFVYDGGYYNKKTKDRIGTITATPKTPFPEEFDTNSLERKRKARDKEEKRRQQFKDPRQIIRCEVCDSEDILWSATPTCQKCHHVHKTITGIKPGEIVIEGEVHEIADEAWLDEETEARPAVQVQAVQQPLAAPARAHGRHPRGIACPMCKRNDRWYGVESEWGETLYSCECYGE